MDMHSSYHVPLALTILSCIFLALGAVAAIVVTVDIVHRKGWRSMMGIMIPVYIINATYLGPLDLFIYYRYGRPTKPVKPLAQSELDLCHDAPKQLRGSSDSSFVGSSKPSSVCNGESKEHPTTLTKGSCCAAKTANDDCKGVACEVSKDISDENKTCHSLNGVGAATPSTGCCSKQPQSTVRGESHKREEPCAGKEKQACHKQTEDKDVEAGHACHSHAQSGSRPYWATVLVGVSHCGAGCVLGDLVGEWLVYGTGANIGGHSVWAELLIDYAFALLFGIVFQYFSIAPMSGQWGPMTIVRAAKADVLSLTSFEIGAFGWMVAYQVGIFGYRLGMDTWLYWWMMQIGMCFGVLTAFPANWYLLKAGVKEPCC